MTKITNLNFDAKLKEPGRHAVGEGLFLKVLDEHRAYWVYRYRANGKGRETSLGSAREVTLAQATLKHLALRNAVKIGKLDPVAEKRAKRQAASAKADAPTFGEVANQYLARQEGRGEGGKNPKHREQWRSTLAKLPATFRDLKVDDIGPRDVFDALDPIWHLIPETASRTRGRIAAVLDWGREPEDVRPNPAAWAGWLKKKLGSPKTLGKIDRASGERVARGNHAAMPYARQRPEATEAPYAVPDFVADLRQADGVAAKALMFGILTAARTSEVVGATWDEINFDAKLWSVPASRMKMGKEHVVPLSDRALAILRGLMAERNQSAKRGKNPHVFASHLPRQPLSDMAMTMLMRRLKQDAFTVHGFRSAFRDWAADTGVDFAVAEMCLAHAVGNKVTGAYLRTTMPGRRREALARWADHVWPQVETAKVVPLRKPAKRT
jgi:integrase